MNQFNQQLQSPEHASEKLENFLKDDDCFIVADLKKLLLLVRKENGDFNVVTPELKVEVAQYLQMISDMFYDKVKLCKDTGQIEKAQKAQQEIKDLKIAFSELSYDKETLKVFFRKVIQAVEEAEIKTGIKV